MKARWIIILIGISIFIGALQYSKKTAAPALPVPSPALENPLSIAYLRQKSYPGSLLALEQSLPDQPNYHQMIVSYLSEGLKIYALLTVPTGSPPTGGFPAIVFNHGYIPPGQYTTTGRYVAYVDGFAKNGFIVLKPDYRGHGESEGRPGSAYYSADYVIDVLNAYASLKQYPGVNQDRIGMWGHSMGGRLALSALVINPNIKASVIWNGVVGTYNDLINNWQHRVRYRPAPEDLALRNQRRQYMIQQFGTPQTNPDFWNSIDPTSFVSDIRAPIQLNVGGNDEEVPVDFSESLADMLKAAGKPVELHLYPGADHNLSSAFSLAMSRSVDFFKTHL